MGDTTIEWTNKTKWCTACKVRHAISEFGRDIGRSDGLATKCLASRRVKVRRTSGYAKGTYRHGWIAPARDGDRRQARRRVNYLVERGELAHPNTLPCTDCAHVWAVGERRHEYDHYLGYDAVNQLTVQAVCSGCHHKREDGRRG